MMRNPLQKKGNPIHPPFPRTTTISCVGSSYFCCTHRSIHCFPCLTTPLGSPQVLYLRPRLLLNSLGLLGSTIPPLASGPFRTRCFLNPWSPEEARLGWVGPPPPSIPLFPPRLAPSPRPASLTSARTHALSLLVPFLLLNNAASTQPPLLSPLPTTNSLPPALSRRRPRTPSLPGLLPPLSRRLLVPPRSPHPPHPLLPFRLL